jgi:hypothetical protein
VKSEIPDYITSLSKDSEIPSYDQVNLKFYIRRDNVEGEDTNIFEID